MAVAFGLDPASVRGPNKPPQFEELINGEGIQDKKMIALQTKADIARHEYEQGIEKLNLTIDLFDTSYRPILNRVQDSDDSQISFTKYNLEKLARYIEQTGRDLQTNAEEISQTVSMITPETDTKIFIDGNKSTTNSYFFQKEKF